MNNNGNGMQRFRGKTEASLVGIANELTEQRVEVWAAIDAIRETQQQYMVDMASRLASVESRSSTNLKLVLLALGSLGGVVALVLLAM